MELKELLKILSKGEGTTIEYKKAQGGVLVLSRYNTIRIDANWDQIILFLVPSWSKKGAKLEPHDWPDSQIVDESEIKKVPSWSEKGAKLLHKETSYLIRILLLTCVPISLNQLMKWMEYSKRQTFRKNYLFPLQQVGFVSMTKPDYKTAKDQKYTITEKGKQFLTGRLD
jgi:ATP-dependent DNA helicase RecG